MTAKIPWTAEMDAELRRVYQTHQYGGVARLARRWNIATTTVSARAVRTLGLPPLCTHPAGVPWTDLELELLEHYQHLSDAAMSQLLARRTGHRRSAKAISICRSRQGFCSKPDGGRAYSPALVASGLGCHPNRVYLWIERGWLKARHPPGTKYLQISPAALRRFLVDYTAHWKADRADKWFLVDILTGVSRAKHPDSEELDD